MTMSSTDTSQTYLLFQTLLLLFCLHPCMIWTKLTRTDAVFSRADSAVFFCAGFWIFRYTGKIHKNYIKNQHSLSFPKSQSGARGQPPGAQAPPWCGQALGRATRAPGSLVVALWPTQVIPKGSVPLIFYLIFPEFLEHFSWPENLKYKNSRKQELATGCTELIG